MEAKMLHEDDRVQVVAVYEKGSLKYMRTTVYDPDGYVEKSIIINADGTYGIV